MFLKKNDDPNWVVTIGGMELGKLGISAPGEPEKRTSRKIRGLRTQRWMALSGITAIVLLCVVGQAWLSRLWLS